MISCSKTPGVSARQVDLAIEDTEDVATRTMNVWRPGMPDVRSGFVVMLSGLCMAATSMADELFGFPNAKQTLEQQRQDAFTC